MLQSCRRPSRIRAQDSLSQAWAVAEAGAHFEVGCLIILGQFASVSNDND
jgi:hypothetical protein